MMMTMLISFLEYPNKCTEEFFHGQIPPSKVVLKANFSPIKIESFPKYWEKLKRDSHHDLSEEYKVLWLFVIVLYCRFVVGVAFNTIRS